MSIVNDSQAALRDAALTLVSVLATLVAYQATVELSLATAAVLAVASAAQMHARLAMGRWRAVAQLVLTVLAIWAAGGPGRLMAALVVSGLAGSSSSRGARAGRRWSRRARGRGSSRRPPCSASWPGRGNQSPRRPRAALLAIAGGVLAAPLLQTLGPLLEWLFGHTTRLTMSEWLSLEHPLLQELWAKAPGTFQHSINVGVLASSAAGAIGGDPLLAHVGGLYHDVGKLRAPGYFIENQHGANPHDALDPWESAAILRAHVTDGIELVRSYGMGDRIAEFVREHHGTTAMRLLRDKAAAMGRLDDEADYRYPGPRPQSREVGVVMLADQVDATARSAPPADEAASEDIVRRTMERLHQAGQLAESGLSARDLDRLAVAFTKAISAMYHRRLTYPPSGTKAPPVPRPPLVPRLFSRRGTR
ncbi:MAG: HDIG domain-containing protein [Vicinamibacterales bacterium]